MKDRNEDNQHIVIYATYLQSKLNEIFPDWGEYELESVLAEFSLQEIIEFLSRINYVLQRDADLTDIRKNIDFLDSALTDDKTKVRRDALEARLIETNQIVLHREQLLGLIRQSLVSETHGAKLVTEDLVKFISTFFLINDLLEADIDEEKGKTTLMAIIRNAELNKGKIFAEELARYEIVYQSLTGNPEIIEKFNTAFASLAGITIAQFLMFGFSVYAHFGAIIKKVNIFQNPSFFYINTDNYFNEIAPELKEFAISFIKGLSLKPEAYRAKLLGEEDKATTSNKYNATNAIWKYPFLEISENKYILLDLRSFEMQLTSGIFWKIHDNSANNKTDRQQLRADYGRLIEEYCHTQLEATIPKSETIEVNYQLIRPENENGAGTDFLIFIKPNIFILIETTVSTVNLLTINSLNEDEFKSKVKGILFGDDEHPQSKVTQFDNTTKWVRQNLNKWGIKSDGDIVIHKILVQERNFPPFAGIWELVYNPIFEAAIGRKFDKREDFISFFDLSDFERMLELINQGIEITPLLEQFKNGHYVGFSNMLSREGKYFHYNQLRDALKLYLKDHSNKLFPNRTDTND